MPINILMPALSPTMTEGKLAKWHVKPGDKITSGMVMCEIETDKATMEVEAVDEGVLGQIVVAEGAEGVAVNAVIAVLLEEGEDASAVKAAPAPASASAPAASAPASRPAPAATIAEVAAPSVSASRQPAQGATGTARAQPVAATGDAIAAQQAGPRLFISPLARRIARDAKLDPAGLEGSGPGGRIVKADIEAAIKGGGARQPASPAAAAPAAQAARAPAPAPMILPSGETRKVPHTTIRKVIARRMLESKQLVPHFYLTVDLEIDALLAARVAINARGKAKISVNDMVIKACAMALRDHPEVNASWTETEMVQYGNVDVAVAVATDRGLVTPIVRQADMKGLARIATEMKDLAARAREGKLKLEEFQGGGFTVSNLGMYGIKDFAGIINPPQAAILAVGAGEERVVVRDGKMAIRNLMSCTLSVDHRVVDGALGAQFLQTLRGYVEQPATMLL